MSEATPSIAAAGPISIPVRKLVELLAESTFFQARVGASSKTDAYPYIHHPELHAKGLYEIKGPLAVVGTAGFSLSRVDNRLLRPSNCSLALVLSDDDRYPDSPERSQTDFENFVGQTLAEIAGLQGVDTRLPIDSIHLADSRKIGVTAATPGQRNVYWMAMIEVHWSRL
jgi:hypothetical protein